MQVDVYKRQYTIPISRISATIDELKEPLVVLARSLDLIPSDIYDHLGYNPVFLRENPMIVGRENNNLVRFIPVGFHDNQGQPVPTFYFKISIAHSSPSSPHLFEAPQTQLNLHPLAEGFEELRGVFNEV